MQNVFETISRENFRNSGYIRHAGRERRSGWQFAAPPRTPAFTADAVHYALQRRENALHRQRTKSSFFRTLLNAFFRE